MNINNEDLKTIQVELNNAMSLLDNLEIKGTNNIYILYHALGKIQGIRDFAQAKIKENEVSDA